jgi:hypothetical protein
MKRRAWQLGFSFVVFVSGFPAQDCGKSYLIPGWGRTGQNTTGYFMAIDRETKHGGEASAMISCDSPHCNRFGNIVQSIKADDYRGKRVRLSGWIKGQKAQQANLWMRVDAPDSRRLAFESKGESGTFNWHKISIVLDVHPSALVINFGLVLSGGGKAWLDDVQLEVLKTARTMDKGPVSGIYEGATQEQRLYERAPDQPVNLDFEQATKPVDVNR